MCPVKQRLKFSTSPITVTFTHALSLGSCLAFSLAFSVAFCLLGRNKFNKFQASLEPNQAQRTTIVSKTLMLIVHNYVKLTKLEETYSDLYTFSLRNSQKQSKGFCDKINITIVMKLTSKFWFNMEIFISEIKKKSNEVRNNSYHFFLRRKLATLIDRYIITKNFELEHHFKAE